MADSIVEVAAAVVQRTDGSFLLAQRPDGKVYAGYWEFPGGKIEQGETPAAALKRELEEELGITAELTFALKVSACPDTCNEFTHLFTAVSEADVSPDPAEITAWRQRLRAEDRANQIENITKEGDDQQTFRVYERSVQFFESRQRAAELRNLVALNGVVPVEDHLVEMAESGGFYQRFSAWEDAVAGAEEWVADQRTREARFDDALWQTLETGAPVLKDALATFDCEVSDTKKVSTHTIYIGEVRAGAARDEEDPLVYFRGGFV